MEKSKVQVDDVKAEMKAQTSLILDKLAVLLDAQRSHQQGS